MDTFDKRDIPLIIEVQEPPPQNTTGSLKYDALFLLNDEIQSKNDEKNEKRWIGYMKNYP